MKIAMSMFVQIVLVTMYCAAADTTAPASVSNQLTVALVDGTKLVCVPALASLPLKTSYADIAVPVEKVASIAFDKDRKQVTVVLVNGDQLRGVISLEMLNVKSLLGELKIPMQQVEAITGKAAEASAEKKYVDSPSKRNGCINNLRIIDSAKEQWALANRQGEDAVVEISGMLEYVKGAVMPKCGSGGTYTVGVIGENPKCSVPGHELPF